MEPMVTISLKEYERLKDLEYQMRFLIDKVEINQASTEKFGIPDHHPLAYNYINSYKTGTIDKNDLKYFYKNLLDIDELIVRGEENE